MNIPDPPWPERVSAHDLRQPLNVMSLILGNVRVRMRGCLLPDDAAYRAGKVVALEQQIARMSVLVDQIATQRDSGPQQPPQC